MITVSVNSQETQSSAYITLLYAELRKIAAGYLKRDRPGNTLQPTALVHETSTVEDRFQLIWLAFQILPW